MADAPERWSLEEYRAYLRILARLRLSQEMRSLLDSSDLVQQTMLKAWANRDQFRGQTTAEYLAWLRRLMANAAFDQARKNGLIGDDPAHKVSLEMVLEESGARLDAILAVDSSPPPAQVIKRETLVRLEQALEQLPDQQRRAVQLHKLEGYSVALTALEMGLSKQAVAGLYARALKTLRKRLEDPQ